MNRIGLFGGSFDPFTVAHMAIVESVLEHDIVDNVTIIPTIVDYHREGKEKWLNESDKFLVMYNFVTRSRFKDKILMDFQELGWKLDGTLSEEEARNWRFIDTLKRKKKLYDDSSFLNTTGYKFYAILGTDSIKNFKTWHRWEDILSMCELIGIEGRDGIKTDTNIPYIPVRIPEKFSSVSSSEIRKKFKTAKEYINSVFGENK
jgi:nicotinate (nicotinamide) nucleotide adenylyltransferase